MDSATERFLLQMKAFADPARLRLVALCRQGECSVSELACVIGQSQPRASQHLRQLCEAGLLDRFRDGRHVFYRLAPGRRSGSERLVALIPPGEPTLEADAARLKRLRADSRDAASPVGHKTDAAGLPLRRALHRALLDLTVAAPLGDLLDIGCGRGRILKLLANHANRAVGVDIDADARQLARTELLLAGLPNCSLRHGDMYRLPFGDGEFDTVILDDVLAEARAPTRVLLQARRLTRAGGRVVILQRITADGPSELQRTMAQWSSAAGLRLGPARLIPAVDPRWLLSAATLAERSTEAA